MPKVNIVKRHKEHGVQQLIFNPDESTIIGTNETEGIEQLAFEARNEGRVVFQMGSDDNYVLYASKKTDGYTRVVTEENWSRDMQLNVFEKDQAVWVANIKKYFELLEKYETKEIEAICYEAFCVKPKSGRPEDGFNLRKIFDDCKDYLCSCERTSKGGQGGRKTDIWKFLCGPGKTKYKKPTARIKAAAERHIQYNTPFKKKKW